MTRAQAQLYQYFDRNLWKYESVTEALNTAPADLPQQQRVLLLAGAVLADARGLNDTLDEAADAKPLVAEVVAAVGTGMAQRLWNTVDGWEVYTPQSAATTGYVFRVASASDAVLFAGEHVGLEINDVIQYLRWPSDPVVFAFPAPRSYCEAPDIEALATFIARKGRSADDWLARWEDLEIGTIHHVLPNDPEAVAAVRQRDCSWLAFEEDSGNTLIYLGEKPIPGQVVARPSKVLPEVARNADMLIEAIEARWE